MKNMQQLKFRPLSVYVHIPFCVKKCSYCDFLSFSGKEDYYDGYVDVLTSEIKSSASRFENRQITTVFFGGGTPTVLNAEQLSQILRIINENMNISKNAEITTEANPGTVDGESLYKLKEAGFNRISFGLQSNKNRLLRQLGRIHNCETFNNNFDEARKAGFDNINIDLMHSLPGQTVECWKETLSYAIEKRPEHISAYGLILEENTALYEKVARGKKLLHDEETQLEMCRAAKEALLKAGYKHYEISNFARPGYQCRHNITYWRCDEYVGFGLGAFSCVGSVRFRNENDLGKYLEKSFEKFEVEEIGFTDAISEFMFLGLRMIDGVCDEEFKARFGKSIGEVYGNTVVSLIKGGLMSQSGGRYFLTERGIDVSNRVFAELLL